MKTLTESILNERMEGWQIDPKAKFDLDDSKKFMFVCESSRMVSFYDKESVDDLIGFYLSGNKNEAKKIYDLKQGEMYVFRPTSFIIRWLK